MKQTYMRFYETVGMFQNYLDQNNLQLRESVDTKKFPVLVVTDEEDTRLIYLDVTLPNKKVYSTLLALTIPTEVHGTGESIVNWLQAIQHIQNQSEVTNVFQEYGSCVVDYGMVSAHLEHIPFSDGDFVLHMDTPSEVDRSQHWWLVANNRQHLLVQKGLPLSSLLELPSNGDGDLWPMMVSMHDNEVSETTHIPLRKIKESVKVTDMVMLDILGHYSVP